MRKILLLFLLISLISCEENQQAPEAIPSESSTSFSDELEVSTNRTVTLLPEARAVVSDWLAYATAHDEIRNLRSRTGSEIVESSNNLTQIMESLRTTLPDTLKSNAVVARTNVLQTKAQVLHQLSNKKQKNPDEIFAVANDLILEFDNFKLQLNELFLKSPENFDQELDQQYERSLQPDSTGTVPLFQQEPIGQ